MWRLFSQTKTPFFHLALFLGLLLRLACLAQPPHQYDMATFEAWGNAVWRYGLHQTYQTIWSDYLPLPMLFFGFIYALAGFFHLAFPLVFRLFWLLVEAVLIFLIRQNLRSTKADLFGIMLWLFPPLFLNTTWWGQIDAIPTLLTLLALILLKNQQRLFSGLFYALAVAIKPIMLIAGPVFFVLGFQKKALPHLFVSGLIVLSLTGLPATLSTTSSFTPLSLVQSFNFVIDQAFYQSNMYQATTINAWNFWSLSGKFWLPDNYPILGITAQHLGLLFFFLLGGYAMFVWAKNKFSSADIYLVAGTLLLLFYTFTTRMHERHLLFALPFLLLGALDSWYGLVLLGGLSLLYLGNLWAAYYWTNHQQVWPLPLSFISLFSLSLVLITLVVTFSRLRLSWFAKIKNLLLSSRLIIFLFLLAFLLRVINLAHPESMIFDEVYHSFTAQQYIHNNVAAWEWWTIPPKGFAYEWTHPPLAKYGMVVGMLLFGEHSFGWRIGSAVFGALSILGLYYLTYQLTSSKKIAALAMFLLSIEGLHLVQSRVGMNDAYMFCFLVWSLVFVLKNRWKNSAFLYGLALASKWSALYGLVPLSLIYLSQVIIPRFTSPASFFARLFSLIGALRLLLIAFLVYLLSFIPFLVAGHSVAQLVELHRQMWYYHTHLVATHDYQSTPLEWMAVARPVWYYVSYGENLKSNIYAQGNPILLWFGLFSFVFLLFTSPKKNYLVLITPAIFTLPWFFSPRIMFFYHYLPTASLLSISSAIVLHSLPKNWRHLFLVLFCLSFLLLSPLYYGYPINNVYWDILFKLFPTWR